MSASGPAPLRFIQLLEELLREGHPVRFSAPGWSMYPTIRHSEIITVAPLGGSPVRAGDVVLYRRGRAAIAHRVIRVRSAAGRSVGFVLRGDAAHCSDRPVEPAQVLGRVLAVERDGRTVRLDLLSPRWSRALGRALRGARDARTKIAALMRAMA